MQVTFRAIQEDLPGDKWQQEYNILLPAYRQWFLKQGDTARPRYLTCIRALKKYMPEIVRTYERLVELAGGGDLAARMLSLYRPTPYLTGCSQAVINRGRPMLVRNYDYSPRLWDAVLWHTKWNGRRVMAMSDCLWGALDGINDAGLIASLAFGGRKVVGEGFGIPLVLRYILEFRETVREACEVLCRVPSHMAYNITLIDADGDYATVYVSPDRSAAVTRRAVATNHQHAVEWRQFAHATASVDRERYLMARVRDPVETADRLADRFQLPPLYAANFVQGWGTLYTSIYRNTPCRAEFRWPGISLPQSFHDFRELYMPITYQQAVPSAT